MKLDKRIIEGKKPLDCFDAENKELIKPFLNKEGYVSNNIANYCFLNKCPKRFLSNVFKEVRDCFTTHINGGNGGDWKYFLPAEWVKPEEPKKKYKPYTLKEFVKEYPLGEEIIIRTKDNSTNRHVLFTEYEEGKGRDDVRLGQYWYTFMILFNNYELYTDGKWHPFGVMEDD